MPNGVTGEGPGSNHGEPRSWPRVRRRRGSRYGVRSDPVTEFDLRSQPRRGCRRRTRHRFLGIEDPGTRPWLGSFVPLPGYGSKTGRFPREGLVPRPNRGYRLQGLRRLGSRKNLSPLPGLESPWDQEPTPDGVGYDLTVLRTSPAPVLPPLSLLSANAVAGNGLHGKVGLGRSEGQGGLVTNVPRPSGLTRWSRSITRREDGESRDTFRARGRWRDGFHGLTTAKGIGEDGGVRDPQNPYSPCRIP